MKTLLSILCIASIGLNVFLLAGCYTDVHGIRLYPSSGLTTYQVERIRNFPDTDEGREIKEAFDREHDHYEKVKGKIVIVLEDTEEIRKAKRVLLYFDNVPVVDNSQPQE